MNTHLSLSVMWLALRLVFTSEMDRKVLSWEKFGFPLAKKIEPILKA